MLGLKPRGRSMDAFTTKLVKTLAGFRVDDLFSREQQIELYLSLCPFGSLKGHEVIGLAAAAEVFYGRPHEELSIAQLAELLARLKNPNFFFPYTKQGETDEQYNIRLKRHEARFQGILDAAVRKRWITAEECSEARGQFLVDLSPVEGALDRLLVPHAALLIGAVHNRVSNPDQMHLVAETDLDDRIQRILGEAARKTARELQPRLPSRGHAGDRIEVDAIVISTQGGIIATRGLATIPGGMASQLKPELYALALERGVLNSLKASARGARIPAWVALAKSRNKEAILLAHQTGLGNYAAHLQTQGYGVRGVWEPMVLGAGVTGSPLLVAGNFAKFGYSAPGVRLEPHLIRRLSDGESGEVLFSRQRPVSSANPRRYMCVRPLKR